MTETNREELNRGFYEKQDFFQKGSTRSFEFRREQLILLKQAIKVREEEILEALSKDLGKPAFEAYTAEIGILYEEINTALRNLKRWMKAAKPFMPLSLQPSNALVVPEPLGVVLILAPWNYPFQLTLTPLVGAMAAGNCAILKPSHQTPETAAILEKIIGETFPSEYISVVRMPGSRVGEDLIRPYPFGHIFFTGSPQIGREIMKLAGEKLIPVTLELGGKSPVVVFKDANLEKTARRIIWGKFYNAGQTCIAPDYLLVEEEVHKPLIDHMIRYIKGVYSEQPEKSPDYGRMVDRDKTRRILELIREGEPLVGGWGDPESCFVAPTLLTDVSLESRIMKEEIFGPVLPVIPFRSRLEAVEIINRNPAPLACYVFTEDHKKGMELLREIPFGGGCLNNTILHVASSRIPFGGVGQSGMGRYHGKHTFDAFSHYKSILRSGTLWEPELKYPPYNGNKLRLARWFLR